MLFKCYINVLANTCELYVGFIFLGRFRKNKGNNFSLLNRKILISFRPSAKQMYYFTAFTCSLNQPEERTCPTDSRLRPDIRKMEETDFDEANRIKLLLEENQRARRRDRETEAQTASEAGHLYEGYKPTWFEYTEDEHSDLGIYVYKGGYWESKEKQDWSNTPKIYLDPPPS